MRLAALLLIAIALASAQQATITFSPQQADKSGLMLWNVDVFFPGAAGMPSNLIYAIAAAHGVGHVDNALANQILATQASRSPWRVAVQIFGASSAGVAVATVVANGGVVSSGTASKIQNAAVVGAGVAAILLPYIKNNAPYGPNPLVAAKLLGQEIQLGATGTGSGMFYSLPVAVGTFTEKLP